MMNQEMMAMTGDAGRPERMVWYRDLVEELTGYVPRLGLTTVPVLIDGMYWQVPQVVASVPAFSLLGQSYGAVRVYGDTEEAALRALCEQVHTLVWNEQDAFVMLASEPAEWLVAGVA